MQFPSIDPVAFHIFGWAVHWYGLAYVTAFLLGLKYVEYSFSRYGKTVNLNKENAETIFTWLIFAVLLGGRLGYVLFYNPSFYINHPLEIIKLWQGGMSFHGGLIGVIVACLIYCYKHKVHLLDLTDRIAPAFCIGLLLGRIANFINGELYGQVTHVSWGIIFPDGGPFPRHPSQLYEAVLEGLVLFIILHFTLQKRQIRGEISGLFLIGYGIFRCFVEFFRERDIQLSTGIFESISMGQILSIPMVMLGIYLVFKKNGGR